MNILYAVLVLGLMGAVFGLLLAVASRVFAVKTDEKLEALKQALPGANCGGCGFSGCAAYAKAVREASAPAGLCTVGGQQTAEVLAQIMGIAPAQTQRRVAQVRCTASRGKRRKGIYEGVKDCFVAAKVTGNGPMACKYGCLGLGNCVDVCQYDAIHIVDNTATVDTEKCTGCMQCARACPRGVIVAVPYGTKVSIPCSSHAKGSMVVRACDIGCIACTKCVKACPQGAISIARNLASIDAEKCIGCGLCVEVCPRHLIKNVGAVPASTAQTEV